MSEYQYYEFQTIDLPLTARQMSELRSYSTRARITATSFVNDYAWGSFKGDEDAWMEEYFDAFLYLANWGTHVVKLRLPSRLLDAAVATVYCGGDHAFVSEKAGKVILSFVSEDEAGDEWIEGEGWLSSLISVRDEVRAWVGKLGAKEKDEVITDLVVDADRSLISELLQRFLKEQSAGNACPVTTGRTVGELLQEAEARRKERERIEAERRAKDKVRRKREAAIARERHLDSLVGREEKLWAEVDTLVATKQPKKYDQAVKLLVDLRDLSTRGRASSFARHLDALRETHARKPSLIERLRKAGM